MQQYEYKIPKLMSFLLLVIFIPMTYFGFNNAITHRAVNYKKIIHLSRTSATLFWAITAILFLAFVIVGILALIKSFGEPRLITIDENHLTAPTKPISNKVLTVPYHEITNYKVQTVGKTRQLILKTSQGKIVMADVNFNAKSDFDEIVRTISQKVRT